MSNVVEIANAALDDACTLASICSCGISPNQMKEDLRQWWEADGASIFLGEEPELPQED